MLFTALGCREFFPSGEIIARGYPENTLRQVVHPETTAIGSEGFPELTRVGYENSLRGDSRAGEGHPKVYSR